ncbi:MAG: hypothetical protein CEO19_442 [Parcubacteria group bacterium Gr01-1014_73]|nr:MAG: hypothetical protein CEO19_442 [Parcubacteria group bacterium Gr01-1014_73]
MTPRNAILFFIIFAVVVGGGIWFFVGGKDNSGDDFAKNLPLPTAPTNAAAGQNQKPNGSWFSKLFSMPSFENLTPNFLPSFPPPTQTPTGAQTETSPTANTSFSPLKGKIYLSRPNNYNFGTSAANYEYITLRADNNIKEKIHLTDLTLKSATSGVKVEIGQGVYLYFSGMINSAQDIFLGPGETAYIITGRSPLGVSFRVNKCLGYLAKNQNFNPYLYSNCPTVRNEPLPKAPNQLNDKCLDYIERFPACTTFTTGKLELSPECNNFLIEKTTYSYCVQTHKNDKDFYQPDWRIYLSRDETLWKSKRETIELLDQNGKLIDSVSY